MEVGLIGMISRGGLTLVFMTKTNSRSSKPAWDCFKLSLNMRPHIPEPLGAKSMGLLLVRGNGLKAHLIIHH